MQHANLTGIVWRRKKCELYFFQTIWFLLNSYLFSAKNISVFQCWLLSSKGLGTTPTLAYITCSRHLTAYASCSNCCPLAKTILGYFTSSINLQLMSQNKDWMNASALTGEISENIESTLLFSSYNSWLKRLCNWLIHGQTYQSFFQRFFLKFPTLIQSPAVSWWPSIPVLATLFTLSQIAHFKELLLSAVQIFILIKISN